MKGEGEGQTERKKDRKRGKEEEREERDILKEAVHYGIIFLMLLSQDNKANF